MNFTAWWTIGLRCYLKSCNFFHWLHCTPKLKDTAFSFCEKERCPKCCMNGQSLLYKHLPCHSVADMKVQILENIYHSSENLVNIRLHQRLRELHWIKELSTVAPYDCNDQIKGVGTLSSPLCKNTNVLGIFNKQQRRKRSHGHRHYNKKLHS